MSVLDEVRALEQRVLKRLQELGPLVAEYRDLEKVAQRLSLKRDAGGAIETAAPDAAEPPKRKPTPKRGAKARASKRAAAGRPKTPAAGEAAAQAAAEGEP